MVKAFAVTTIHRRVDGKEQIVPASTAKKVSVFDVDKAELDDLRKLGGAREATKEEIALAKAQAQAEGNDIDDGNDVPQPAPAPAPAPSSGAPGDPKSSPKAASGKAAKAAEPKDGEPKDGDLDI